MTKRMPDPEIITLELTPLTNAALAKMNDEQLTDDLERTSRAKEALSGRVAQLAGEIARRQGFRAKGAASMESYLIGQLGLSRATARAFDHVAERLFDLPDLQTALSAGEVTFDKVRAIADVADPESDAEWAETAASLPVAELAELAQRWEAQKRSGNGRGRDPERATLRRNDAVLTLTARFPRVEYAEVCARIEAHADLLGADDETPYDERLAEALMSLLRDHGSGDGSSAARKGSPHLVVAHVALDDLFGDAEKEMLGADLERGGLISLEVARRLACDGSFVVSLDDEAGHSMYEGRARRFPTDSQRRELWRRDRHCRFPGCSHLHLIQAHHVVPWTPRGQTDLDNLALLCPYHHHEVHSNAWSVSGNANEALNFVGPDGRVVHSYPSPLWGTIGAGSKRSASATREVRRVDRGSG
jgi:hypothetical protein